MRFIGGVVIAASLAAQPVFVSSPDGTVVVEVSTGKGGALGYTVSFRGKAVVQTSRLGLDPQGQPPLGDNVRLVGSKPGKIDETYTMPHGKANPLRNHCNTAEIDVEDTGGQRRRMTVDVRAYDDGVAFRYRVPEQAPLRELRLEKELTQINLAKDGTAFPLVLSGYRTSYEDSYLRVPVTSLKPEWLIALPLLVEMPGVAWVGVTEAHLENYSGMYLKRGAGRVLEASLAPRVDDPSLVVTAATPMQTPWRVLMISDRPGGPVESNIVLHSNPPSRIGDASWVKPGKTSWSWWSGDYATGVPFQPGMNTETMKHYVDFSAETGLEYILIDEGWSGGEGRHNRDVTRTNPNIDLAGIIAHAKAKGVRVWLWAHWTNVDKQADEAFPLFEKWGIAGVKIDFMDRDDQQMVEFYHRAARKAAEHKLLVDFHGAYKPTGLRKYYPNVLTHEGVMGLEYLKWSGRVTAEHNTMIPFTRMLAGPLDYTPGGFVNVTPEEFTPRNLNPTTPTTRAHQVGLYVVFETGFQMLADFPGAYKGEKETEFLKAVPVTWDETKVLAGYPGRFIVMARRKGKDWFIGGITNSEPREVTVPLGFLGGGSFRAEIIEDSPDAARIPKNTASRSETVSASSRLRIRMAPAGGMAALLRPTG